MQRRVLILGATVLVALAVACGEQAKSPAAPTPATVATGASAAPADGSTLKVNGPTLVSPKGGVRITDTKATLTLGAAAGKFAAATFTYRVQLLTQADILVQEFTGAGLSYTTTSDLDPDTTFKWRARAELEGAVGPWTGYETFKSPERPSGYISGNEIFDPLTDGKTVGVIWGEVQFIPNQGVKLLNHDSHITYLLPATLEAGEFSIMVTGMDEGSPGSKTKVMSMQEGTSDITSNDYRFTFEKRGREYVPAGAVTYRMITGNAEDHEQIHDGRRYGVAFSDELWYFWKAAWTQGGVLCEVREGGPTGGTIYGEDNDFSHPYRPSPHYLHLGAPVGRAGPSDATVPGMIIKNVWISPRPRPSWVDAGR